MPNWTDENGVSHFMCETPGCCGNPWKTLREIEAEERKRNAVSKRNPVPNPAPVPDLQG